MNEAVLSRQSSCSRLDLDVTISTLVEGEPARLAFYKVLTLKNGNKKHCSQVVQVTDTHLLQRLRDEVHPGDAIHVTIETNWSAKGMPTTLKDFYPAIPDSLPTNLLNEQMS